MTEETDPEILYLREIEDCFAALRGQPHILSPRDMHLARTWWNEGIPLQAVHSGISEVVARKSLEGDVVLSLSYCRHAVRKHAKELTRQRTGLQEDYESTPQDDESGTLERLIEAIKTRAHALIPEFPRLSDNLYACVGELESLASGECSDVYLALFELETTLLSSCFKSLPTKLQEEILKRANEKARASRASGQALERAQMVFRDKLLREFLELPSFE